ncbi:MAG: plasmid pRiA4b ORF-3 family protein [Pseudonocardiaceae bacterium]
MSDAATSSNPAVYQLRVVLAGVSPLIWRRLLVPAETTIAELHAVLRAAFGWGGEHLHRFVIHGREYGISSLGGAGFRDDAREIRLSGFGFRVGERFAYDYDFTDGWRHDLRVERILAAERGRSSRAVPVVGVPAHLRIAADPPRPAGSGDRSAPCQAPVSVVQWRGALRAP